MEKLDARIKGHDHEIERMCNYHYQGFIDSIRELQQVSGDATKLKVSILNMYLIVAHTIVSLTYNYIEIFFFVNSIKLNLVNQSKLLWLLTLKLL